MKFTGKFVFGLDHASKTPYILALFFVKSEWDVRIELNLTGKSLFVSDFGSTTPYILAVYFSKSQWEYQKYSGNRGSDCIAMYDCLYL